MLRPVFNLRVPIAMMCAPANAIALRQALGISRPGD